MKRVEWMFTRQQVEQELAAGDNSIVWAEAYEATDYEIKVYSALDAEEIDVRGELEILEVNKTVNGFIVNAVQPCTIKVIAQNKVPRTDYYTEG